MGDRATFFFEIIQRIGCTISTGSNETDNGTDNETLEQTPGCGGFGKGNFHELFRAIEEYETDSGLNAL